MSSFYCPKCQKAIIDSPGKGYITGCEHFPLIKKDKTPEMPDFLKEIFNFNKK